MGRLTYGMSVSLDGFVETPSRSLDWVRVDEELHSFFNAQGRELGASLYGRRMYELMAGYWPTAEKDPEVTPAELAWAEIWKSTPKIVFSSSLEGVGWNSRLVQAMWLTRPRGSRPNRTSSWTSAARRSRRR